MRLLALCCFTLVQCLASADRQLSKKLSTVLMQQAKEQGLYEGPLDIEELFLPEGDHEESQSLVSPLLPGTTGPRVNTTSGLVTGDTNSHTHLFYEIPYAEPPIGDLRFQPPQRLKTAQEIDASRNTKLQCYQMARACTIPGGEAACNLINMEEDCLILNIYVPNHVNLSDSSSSPNVSLPVMFYIHGGSFNGGTGQGVGGSELAYFANVIVVTPNYRLGPLGFLVNREEGKPDINGNQGIKDQQMALKWVNENIENFGGNKDKVTIFGGSAGAQSVMFHTLSKESAPYYTNAIQQSNPAYIEFQTPEESQRISDIMAKKLCNDTESTYDCLMNADPIKLVNRQIPLMVRSFFAGDLYSLAEPFRPVIDGDEFTDQPLNLYESGKWNSGKDLIIGVNIEELDDIEYFLPERFPTGELIYSLANYYIVGIGKTEKVVTQYSEWYPPEDGDYIVPFSREMSHMFFICPSRALARMASRTVKQEAKVYFYADAYPIVDGTCKSRNNGSDDDCYLVTHDDETRFVMRTVGSPSEDDLAVENQFSTYWGSFARTGDPSSGLETSLGDFPDWPEYIEVPHSRSFGAPMRTRKWLRVYSKLLPLIMKATDGTESWRNIRIQAPVSEVEVGYEEDACDFWDSLGIYMNPIPLPTTTTTKGVVVTNPPQEKTTSGVTSVIPRQLVTAVVLAQIMLKMYNF